MKLPRGVTRIARLKTRPYKAQICDGNRRMRNLGYYATPQEAHMAWLRAAVEKTCARQPTS